MSTVATVLIFEFELLHKVVIYNGIFTDNVYRTCEIGIFRCQEAELVPFSYFTSVLVAKYNSFVCTNYIR